MWGLEDTISAPRAHGLLGYGSESLGASQIVLCPDAEWRGINTVLFQVLSVSSSLL